MGPEPAGSEDLVADAERSNRGADGLDLAGEVDPERSPSRPTKSGDQPPEDRTGGAGVRVGLADGRGTDPDQDLVVFRNGPLDLLDPEHIRRPVAVLDDGFHAVTPYRVGCSPTRRRWRRIGTQER